MSKCLNEENFKDVILRVLAVYKQKHDDRWDYDTYEEKNPYGDTWATTSIEYTDESIEECDEDFKENFDAEDFICNVLSDDLTFREMIEALVKENF